MDIILGIDPGSRITGYGIIQTDGWRHRYVASGCLVLEGETMTARLQQIYRDLVQLVKTYHPNQAAIEQVFLHRNASSALKLGQARGAAIVAIATTGVPVAEYSPREIKQAIVGFGGAEKIQIQQMVKRLLNLPTMPESDAADALAIAICHVHSSKTKLAHAKANLAV